jgi:hypothetical protein
LSIALLSSGLQLFSVLLVCQRAAFWLAVLFFDSEGEVSNGAAGLDWLVAFRQVTVLVDLFCL